MLLLIIIQEFNSIFKEIYMLDICNFCLVESTILVVKRDTG